MQCFQSAISYGKPEQRCAWHHLRCAIQATRHSFQFKGGGNMLRFKGNCYRFSSQNIQNCSLRSVELVSHAYLSLHRHHNTAPEPVCLIFCTWIRLGSHDQRHYIWHYNLLIHPLNARSFWRSVKYDVFWWYFHIKTWAKFALIMWTTCAFQTKTNHVQTPAMPTGNVTFALLYNQYSY